MVQRERERGGGEGKQPQSETERVPERLICEVSNLAFYAQSTGTGEHVMSQQASELISVQKTSCEQSRRQTTTQVDRYTSRQTNTQTDRQGGRRTHRQTDRQGGR